MQLALNLRPRYVQIEHGTFGSLPWPAISRCNT
jgi:hypothetical protein